MGEATAAGYNESAGVCKSFPKKQILTIEKLLNGTEQALYPDLSRKGLTFKKAKAEEKQHDQKDLFKAE